MTSSTPGYFGSSSALMRFKLQRAGDALHAGADRQHVFRANGTIGVAEALEGVTVKRSLRGRDGRCEFEFVEFRRRRHRNSRLAHPLSGQDSLRGGTDHLVVTADRRAFRNIR